MPYYHKIGQVPAKRHTQFRQPDGSLYHEELVSSQGFSGIYSLLYHRHAPTRIEAIGKPKKVAAEPITDMALQPLHLKTAGLGRTGTHFLDARLPVLLNNDVVISLCHPQTGTDGYYYKNGEADELIFVHEGQGFLDSQFGRLPFFAGDYIVIPRTVIYKIQFEQESPPPRLLIIEAFGPIETVDRYRNQLGQLLEHSPYCERDIRPPAALTPLEPADAHLIYVRKQGFLHEFSYTHSPFDIVGWDGFLYPYCLSIHDFEPITGRLHQPPPVHQTFQGHNFVVCSFVPRLFDYHPLSIPAPYNHSNIDSDELLYYVDGNFMSRRGIDQGSFTLHPGGLPHGPHPGTVEASIGVKETHELAVMIDTFKPLLPTKQGLKFMDSHYWSSWK